MDDRVDWNLVIRLALGGAVLAILLGLGLIPIRFTPYLWFALAFVWAVTIGRRSPHAPWRTAIVVGALGGFIAGDLLAFVFYGDYVEALRDAAPTGNGTTDPLTVPRTAVVLSGVINGLFFGLLAGLSAWIMAKGLRRQEPEADSDTQVELTADDSEE